MSRFWVWSDGRRSKRDVQHLRRIIFGVTRENCKEEDSWWFDVRLHRPTIRLPVGDFCVNELCCVMRRQEIRATSAPTTLQ